MVNMSVNPNKSMPTRLVICSNTLNLFSYSLSCYAKQMIQWHFIWQRKSVLPCLSGSDGLAHGRAAASAGDGEPDPWAVPEALRRAAGATDGLGAHRADAAGRSAWCPRPAMVIATRR